MADELESSLSTSGTQSVSLTSAQEKLCRQLDELYDLYGLEPRPSAMFRGALFAIREAQNNPDWLAQAAHSLREILHPFWGPKIKAVPDRKKNALIKFGSVFVDDIEENIGRIYGTLSDLAHHGIKRNLDFSNYKISDFESLRNEFETSMRWALTRQIDVHNQIDKLFE